MIVPILCIIIVPNQILTQVEYLLFECLQDLTGGNICFYLASYSYMVDITTAEDRTRRMSILDSALPAGLCWVCLWVLMSGILMALCLYTPWPRG